MPPQEMPVAGFTLNSANNEAGRNLVLAAGFMGCAPALVDVLASGQGYLFYSVFDHDGMVNPEAMTVLSTLTGITSDAEDEDHILRGPVLVVLEQGGEPI